ncbi:MAG: hypothetical protein K8T10_16220 [Candidatus Eremiobacteraeota bacterium]|nr:hypothetical protein [Candidatus Eremiobacteraeota bacterium]
MADTHHDALSVVNNASIGGNLSVTGDLDVDGSFDLAGGFSLTDDDKLQIRDAQIYINSSTDGQLDLDADVEVEVTAPTTQIVATTKVDIDGGEIDIDAGAGKAVGINIADQTTDNTTGGSVTVGAGKGKGSGDGGSISLTAAEPQATSGTGDGGSVNITAADAVSGDKDGGDVVLTAGTKSGSGTDGQIKIQDDVLINSTEELRFQDSDTKVYSSTDGQLDVDADQEVEVTAPTVHIVCATKFDLDGGEFDVDTAAGKPASIVIGNQTTNDTAGGAITFTAGEGNGTGDGGAVNITSGAPETSSGTGDAGAVNITGADAVAGDKNGGDVIIIAGAKSGSGADGQIKLQDDILINGTEELRFQDSATKIVSSTDGQLDVDADVEVEVTAPITQIVATTKVDIDGGDIDIDAGAGKAVTIDIAAQGTADTAGGAVGITAGKGKGTGDGGGVNITAAEPEAATGTGNGGGIVLTAGDAVSGDKNGGAITLAPGAKSGTGYDGMVMISSTAQVATDKQIQFRDGGLMITSSVDGQLDIDADVELEVTAPTIHMVCSTKLDLDGGGIDIDAGAGKNIGLNITDQATPDTAGGNVMIGSGKGKGTGNGGNINLVAAEPEAASGTGNGGSINITAADAVAGDKDGGNVTITAGAKSGAGTDGQVKIQDDILVDTSEELRFRDSDLAIYSSVDGQLDIKADDGVVVTAPNLTLAGSDSGLTVRQVAKALYEFSEHGGSQGTIGLGVTLPANAVVTKVYYKVAVVLASSGAATVEFGFTGDTAVFVPQQAFDNAIYLAGWQDGTPDGTAATFVDSTEKEIAITIGTADLTTQGEILLWVEYVLTY